MKAPRSSHRSLFVADPQDPSASLALEKEAVPEERWRAVLDGLCAGVWVVDTRGLCVYANRRLGQMLGWEVEQLLGRPVLDFVFEEDRGEARRRFLATGDQPKGRLEFRLRRRSGGELWVQAEARPLEAGQLVWTLTDITCHRQHELKLHKRLEEAEGLIDDLPIGVFTPPETSGPPKTASLVQETQGVWVSAASREQAAASASSLRRGRFSSPTRHWQAGKNGWRLVEERAQVQGAFGRHWEIPRRKQIEEVVRREHAFTAAVLHTTLSLIVVLDRHGAIVWINRACEQLTGYRAEEVVGRVVWELFVPPAEAQQVKHMLGELWAGGELPLHGENHWLCRGSKPRLIAWANTVMRTETGQVEYVISTGIDITERKQNEYELKRMNEELKAARDAAIMASQAKSAFLANMSHELRTPLNGIIGYSEMLEEDALAMDKPEFIEDLRRIRKAGKHLLALISDILDLSRIEAGHLNMHLENFALVPVIHEALASIEPMLEQNSNCLEIDCPGELGSMYADPEKLRQILCNLLGNAVKFTERGTVTLQVQRKSFEGCEWVEFRVRDTGIGMSSEQMSKLFESFSQADTMVTRRYGGSGLGLAISKAYCEVLGGTISVESELGKGSTFTLRLPAAARRRLHE